MQSLDRIRLADRFPLAFREVREGEELVAGLSDVARRRRCGVSLTCQQICYVLYLVM